MISAVAKLVISIGRSSGAYSSTIFIAARGLSAPITIRSGFSVSWMAEPSRRNSGFETTSNSCGSVRCCSIIRRTRSPVPTGTVDLLTTIL
jgi:hypothetical protein